TTDLGQVVLVGFAVAATEGGDQMGRGADEVVPGADEVRGTRRQDLAGAPQRLGVLVGPADIGEQPLQVVAGHWGPRSLVVRVAGGCRSHRSTSHRVDVPPPEKHRAPMPSRQRLTSRRVPDLPGHYSRAASAEPPPPGQ